MPREISKSTFKACALEIMRSVEKTGENVVITAHGKPTLIIKQYRENEISPLDKLKGSVVSYHSPTEPIDEDDCKKCAPKYGLSG